METQESYQVISCRRSAGFPKLKTGRNGFDHFGWEYFPTQAWTSSTLIHNCMPAHHLYSLLTANNCLVPLLKSSHPDYNSLSNVVRLNVMVASRGLPRRTQKSDGLTQIVSLPMDSPKVMNKQLKHLNVSNELDIGEPSPIPTSSLPKRSAGRPFRRSPRGA